MDGISAVRRTRHEGSGEIALKVGRHGQNPAGACCLQLSGECFFVEHRTREFRDLALATAAVALGSRELLKLGCRDHRL